jgi:tetratricopeptide (TPR) repeat protein
MENIKEITRAQELNKRGIIFIETQQREDALKYFNKAIDEDADYLGSYYNKAIVYKALEKYDEAIKCYDLILKKDMRQGDAYFQKANVLFFNKNDVRNAIELYNKAIFLGVKNETIYFCLGLCSEALGSKEDALRWIDRAIRINEKRTDYILEKGKLLIEVGRYPEAEKSFDKILMLEADNEEAYHFKSIVLKQQGKYTEAFRVLKDGEKLIGEKPIFQYGKALMFESQGKFQEALDVVENVLKFNGNSILLLGKKGSLLLLLSRGEEAKVCFDKITDLEPENMEAYFNKAGLCIVLQEFEDASIIFENIILKAENDNPYKINSYYYRALTLKKAGKVEEAQVAYKFALKNYNVLSLYYPSDAQLFHLKANTLRDMERYEEAEEFYEYSIDLNKEMVEVHLNRAKNFIFLCKVDEAKKAVRGALTINPSYKAVVELSKDLKNYIN